ncbi:MAG: TatD family hydrolase [Bacteroidales bacterium]|nr:TatD family hydrolase [Bacteroidales bacterium]MDD3892434.1 TatD family hydrolase [Bacteroidales bacterium]
MQLIDTHSHLFTEEFNQDRSQAIDRAKDAGVSGIVLPNINCDSIQSLLDTAIDNEGYCFPCIGLHPTSVKANYRDELRCIEEEFEKNKYYAIGEIGIDLYWDKTFINEQVDVFRHQLKLAKEHDLPVIIHSRNSFNEIFSVVDQEIDKNLRGVFHSFTGGINEYNHIMGYKSFYVGIGGVVTFKNGGVDKVVQNMDLNRIVLETDSPYLSPAPHRGKRNESANLPVIAQKIAGLLQVPVEQVARITTQNAKELFGI